MTLKLRAHFDGTAIIPDEPLALPAGEALEVEITVPTRGPDAISPDLIAERRRRLRAATGTITGRNPIPLEALRREHLYEERP